MVSAASTKEHGEDAGCRYPGERRPPWFKRSGWAAAIAAVGAVGTTFGVLKVAGELGSCAVANVAVTKAQAREQHEQLQREIAAAEQRSSTRDEQLASESASRDEQLERHVLALHSDIAAVQRSVDALTQAVIALSASKQPAIRPAGGHQP